MTTVHHETLFDVPIETAYRVLSDYASYPEYVEGTDGVKVIEMSATGGLVEYNLNIMTKTFRYVLKMTQEEPTLIKWELESGDIFKKNSGHWKLHSQGNKTMAEYGLDVDLKIKVPGLIMKKLVSSNIPKLMKSYNQRMIQAQK